MDARVVPTFESTTAGQPNAASEHQQEHAGRSGPISADITGTIASRGLGGVVVLSRLVVVVTRVVVRRAFRIVVYETVTVVVDQVATDLGHVRMGVRIGIIAVVTAALSGKVTVPIRISVIAVAVAVVVDAIADFFRAQEDAGVLIVTIPLARHLRVSINVEFLLGNETVAITIHSITDFVSSGKHQSVIIVTIPITGCHPIPVEIREIQSRIRVIAIPPTRACPIPVPVLVPDGKRPIAVVIFAIARLDSIRVCLRGIIVAIDACEESIFICVDFVGGNTTITVIV